MNIFLLLDADQTIRMTFYYENISSAISGAQTGVSTISPFMASAESNVLIG